MFLFDNIKQEDVNKLPKVLRQILLELESLLEKVNQDTLDKTASKIEINAEISNIFIKVKIKNSSSLEMNAFVELPTGISEVTIQKDTKFIFDIAGRGDEPLLDKHMQELTSIFKEYLGII